MGLTDFSGPVISFGRAAGSGTTGTTEYNSDQGPSLFDQGTALLDPRAPFGYAPGQRAGQGTYGWYYTADILVVDQVPSTLATNNIALAQVPVAGTPLTLTAGTGVTGGTTITRADTGAQVTGVLAIDGAMTPVSFGQGPDGSGGPVKLWDPTKAVSRNLRFTSAGNDSAATAVIRGFDLYGFAVAEQVTLANAGVASSVRAYKYILSITPAGTLSGSNLSAGTGDVYGFPIRADTMRTGGFGEVQVTWNGALVTATTGFVAAVTTNPATITTGDVRGTYAVQGAASDNARRLQIYASPTLANIQSAVGLYGVAQFTNF